MDEPQSYQIDDASDPPEFETSESDTSQIATLTQTSRLRPAGSALSFVPYADWEPERSYEGEPTIRYNVEWTLFVKNRTQAGESELDVVISPRNFWKYVLRPKVIDASADEPWAEDKTKLIMSVTDRRTRKITKFCKKLEVDWPFVTRQLQEWSKFLKDGKKITLTVTFYYKCVDTGKSSRGGATANQLADLDARTEGLGRGACIKKAYALMRCPDRSCTKGDHCWQYEGKHYRLLPHHIRMLADHLQAGRVLNGHDDVPDEFRRLVMADAREQEEREQKELEKLRKPKRRRRYSDDSSSSLAAVRCHRCALLPGDPGIGTSAPSTPQMVFSSSSLPGCGLFREDAVRAYTVWQQSQVSTEEQKEHYDAVQELTLAHCYDLDMLAANQKRMFGFYTKHGVPAGIAWRYVRDVEAFLEQRET
ncbi:uncharacterized protein CTRU02_214335 [Colletotrichum truncatum]|uniref:Uncharacterized protein n=1 Tax=Colletotrichum truncatum TaxID=5467 RepID=A0ACC3YEL2_COLTU|nr:uncharacterized protein CTRU02_13563 [Colletotrichum truncatum]KAF6783327.1 hypothetical protein CTRU02_13563 [Colletotrichum truncatum]